MTDVVVDPAITDQHQDLPRRAQPVNLSNGEHLDLYDTSGPYTDPEAVVGLDTEKAIGAAMEEKSKEFAEHGNRVYLPLA